MVGTLLEDANVTVYTMVMFVNTEMNASKIVTVENMAPAWTLKQLLRQENSVIVNLVGLDQAAIKVSGYNYNFN